MYKEGFTNDNIRIYYLKVLNRYTHVLHPRPPLLCSAYCFVCSFLALPNRQDIITLIKLPDELFFEFFNRNSNTNCDNFIVVEYSIQWTLRFKISFSDSSNTNHDRLLLNTTFSGPPCLGA